MRAKMRLDIKELISTLKQMNDEGYITAEIIINESGYYNEESEMELSVIEIENDNEVVGYSRLSSIPDEFNYTNDYAVIDSDDEIGDL